MSWESIVSQLIGSGRPRSVYSLSESWTQLGKEFQSLADHVTRLKDMTANDALTPDCRPTNQPPTQGKGWTGPAADAFREHVARIAKEASDLVAPSQSIGAALGRIADALATGISQTPVPIFQDRNLPGGIDVHDIIVGGAPEKDSGTEFAQRLRQDMDKGGKYYADGGFRTRIDEVNDFRDDGGTGGVFTRRRFVANQQQEVTEYRRRRDNWYAKNQAAATAALHSMLSSYQEEFSNVAPIVVGGSVSDLHDVDNPLSSPDAGAGGSGAGGAGGSGLAGVGGGFSSPAELASGTGVSLTGAGTAASTGITGGGTAGVGARAMGMGMGMGMPGLFSPGSASAGTGRSPMPALTSANKAMGVPAVDPMDPQNTSWAEATSWSRDEEDVWGTEPASFPTDLLS